ncbi:glycine zipper 2TM domain-containing protein [Pigmentiphaga aceris]|uniref:Glycine zipper 2TM domain-containing protein n=1 Tax=Pigmentiphaga aceris TaxID=1940612 RepID=A0A5C0AS87_9BURK|nr:glycine zipper 2TM domain-containing protein [Pigmentiphaga aceris]QEI04536.1 glycine zipper 2TM domain-containing protein [Pigmentiphaga aceris]
MAHYPENTPASPSRMHPLLVTAIVSFIALCAVGIAVLTGMLPSPLARTVDRPPASVALAEEAARADKAAEDARIAAEQARAAADDAARKEAALQAPRGPVAPPPAALAAAPVAAVCNNCGVVQSVTSYQVKGEGTGLGAIAGGVLGGVVGNQFGGGNGRTALTLLGAGGGAYAGHEVEKNVRTNTRYQMKVRMNDGSVKTYTSATPFGWRNGDPVRVVNGQVVARNAG